MITIGFRQVTYNVGEADGVVTLFVAVRTGVLDDGVDVRLYTGDDTAGGMDAPIMWICQGYSCLQMG